MPSANSAAGGEPIRSASAVRRRLRNSFVATLVGLSLLMPAGLFSASSVAAHAGNRGECTRWTSTTTPPDSILVYRNKSGRIDRVPFRRYVIVVLGKEWPGYLPHALIAAGAVAAKQYAWYHALQAPRYLKDGRCFNVRDGIQDQLYRPNKSRVRQDHYNAVDATWHISLIKRDRFFMTGYRRGYKGRCGRDANGWKLFARTGTRCANAGKDYLEILRIYYGPDLEIRHGSRSVSSAQIVSVPGPARSVLLHVL